MVVGRAPSPGTLPSSRTLAYVLLLGVSKSLLGAYSYLSLITHITMVFFFLCLSPFIRH